MVDGNKWKQNGNKKSPLHQCSECFRSFSSRAGLWKHMKACKYIDIKNDSEESGEFKDLVLLLLKENKEIQKNFLELIPQMKGNAENSVSIYLPAGVKSVGNEKCQISESGKSGLEKVLFISI